MKKVLFVIPNLKSGGAEKSLISVLSLFDYSRYEVDLLVFRREGLFLEKIPGEVNYIYDTTDYEMFDGSAKDAISYFFKKNNIGAIIDRIKYVNTFKGDVLLDIEYKSWNVIKNRLPKITKKYDCVIGYLEGGSNDFASDFKNAERRVCYVHSDIKRLPYLKERYLKNFEKCDNIVTVSALCRNSIAEVFPQFESKICVIENITSERLLEEEAGNENVFPPKNEGEQIILTVGRCAAPKNIELAVDACFELKKRGCNIKWYHIGKGDEFESVKKYVSGLNLENEFIMLGERSNPYPYMKQCDIYVQPSRFEGKSIAIDEVKCFNRPIVVTNYPSVGDQITDGINGLVCSMTKEDMADKIESLIDNPKLKEKLTKNLKNEKTGNEEELEKLYKLIEG